MNKVKLFQPLSITLSIAALLALSACVPIQPMPVTTAAEATAAPTEAPAEAPAKEATPAEASAPIDPQKAYDSGYE